MIKKATDLSKLPNNNPSYLITASLLNSWENIWGCISYVREGKDECLEDRQDDARAKAKEEFINTLNRIEIPPNEYMIRGIEYEDECYKGNTEISPIIKGGAFQIVGKKNIEVGDMNILLYGRLDVLKGGVIYDIKRVSQYTTQKYINSHQHPIYLELFPEAKCFTYLVCDNYNKIHTETYYRDTVEDVKSTISDFLNWLKDNNLLELYKSKWQSKY